MENEKRLIDANALKARINGVSTHWLNDWSTLGVLAAVDKQPTVDAVEVVRCKDCKHRGRETYCPMCFEEWYEIDEGDGYYDSDFEIHDRTIDEGFCDRGEREDNG